MSSFLLENELLEQPASFGSQWALYFCVEWLSAVINCEREHKASLIYHKTCACIFSLTAEVSLLVKC